MKIQKSRRKVAWRVGVSAFALGAALALPVVAQEADDGTDTKTLDTVVVQGFRQSIEDALAIKRNSNEIIESISAEDIGKFPDQNIAESLGRLPGIQIDRENGQGTKVRIRGLEQNETVLNGDLFLTGLEVFKLGEGRDRKSNSLEGIPAELLSGVDVYKSPNASLVEGGVGGLINLKTRDPMSLGDDWLFGGNLRFSQSTDADDWEPTGAVAFGKKFNDQFAFIGTISYDKQGVQTDYLGGQNRGNWSLSDRPDAATVTTDYFAPEYRYTTDRFQERERLGASLGFAYQATPDLKIRGDWFHSDIEILTQEASIKFPVVSESTGIDASQPYEIDSRGVLLSGVITANSAEAISFVNKLEASSDNFQLNFDWADGGAFTWSGGINYSVADQTSNSGNADVRYTQYSVPTADAGSPTGFSHQAANPGAPANYQYSYNNNGGTLPSFGLVNVPDLFTNPAYGYFKSHWAFGDEADLTNWSGRLDTTYTPDFVEGQALKISGGLRYSDREVDYASGRYLADYSGKGEPDGTTFGQNWTPYGYFQDGAIGYKICDVPIADRPAALQASLSPALQACDARFGNSPPLITPFETFGSAGNRVETINGFWNSGNAGTNSALVQDRGAMSDPLAWIQGLYPDTPFGFFEEPIETFVVTEKKTAAYIMADLGDETDRYHINAGVRIVNTDLTVNQGVAPQNPTYWGTDSWNGVTQNATRADLSRDYTDILPSINGVLDVTENTKVRASAARVVSRQDLFDLGRGAAFEFTRDPATNLFVFTSGTAGNANLDPFRASQFDFAVEHYMGDSGLVSAALFWKEVDSFITNETKPEEVADQSGFTTGPVTRPVNGDGGNIKGFELGAQYAFDNGFGFIGNYTYSDSESPTESDLNSDLPIPGVAKNAFNGQVYYEGFGFDARLSYTWRDKSFERIFGFSDGAAGARAFEVWNRSYGQLDAQIGYQVSPNFKLTLEAVNLSEDEQSQYLQYDNLPFTYSSGSRRILIGGRYVFGN